MKRLLLAALLVLGLSAPAAAHHAPWHCGGNSSPDFIIGTLGPDRLVGTPCEDIVLGLAGRDVLFGLGGFDILRGGPGRDWLRGVDGEHDRLNGMGGRDRCVGDAIDTFVSCEVKVVR